MGVQVEGESGVTDDAGGSAQVMNLDEIIGISGLLAGTLKVAFPTTLIFMMFSPLPFRFLIWPGSSR